MPQLQNGGASVQPFQRRNGRRVKFIRPVGAACIGAQLVLREFLQIELHHLNGPLGIGHRLHFFQRALFKRGNALRQEQSAVAAQSLHDGLRGRAAQGCVSCAYIVHAFTTFIQESQNSFCVMPSEYPHPVRYSASFS